jgi:hypothetical protein
MPETVEWRGRKFDPRTARMLGEVARLTKPLIRPTQGSFSTGVQASASTHAGGGAVDISVRHWSASTVTDVVRIMRTVGFAAWHRVPSEGPWPAHVHGIAIGCDSLSAAAQRQVDAYRDGRNGLKSKKQDTGPRVAFTTFEQYLDNGKLPDVLPRVSVGRLRKAARTDPSKPSNTADYPTGTKRVEAALVKEGLLKASLADSLGHFGSKTVEAFAAWQRKLGFKGADADGVPGRTSLTRLGAKHGFAVSD